MSFIEKLKIVKQYWPSLKFYFYSLRKKNWPLYGLIFQVTNKCNSRCLMCFNWQVVNTETEELSLSEIEKFASSLGRLPSITLGGGEPFLRGDLPEICEIFFREAGTKKISIPTNSLSPDIIIAQIKEILEKLPIKLKIILSLDGVAQVHDKIRGVPGNFEKFLENYKRLGQLAAGNDRLQLSVNTTVSEENEAGMAELINFVDHHPDIRFHTLEVIRGSFDAKKIHAPNPERYAKLLDAVLFKSKTLNKEAANKLIYKYYHRIALKIMENKKQLIPCRVASFFPVIDAWGNVYNCELLGKIGNLRDNNYDFKKIWNSSAAKMQRQDIAVGKCWCTHYCYQVPNILMSPRHFFKALFLNKE